MLEGRTADCLAIANTAILMRLIKEFIERGLIGRQGANALLCDAADTLANLPECRSQQFRGSHRGRAAGTLNHVANAALAG